MKNNSKFLLLAIIALTISGPSYACSCVSELMQGVRQIQRTTDSDKSKFASQAAFCYLSETEDRFKSATSGGGNFEFFEVLELGVDGSYDSEKINKAREQYCSSSSNQSDLNKLATNLSSRFDQYSLRALQSCLNSCKAGGLFCNILAEDDATATVAAKWNPVGGVNETIITGASVTGAKYIKPLIGDDPLAEGKKVGSQGLTFDFEKSAERDMKFTLQTSGGTCTVTSEKPELTVEFKGQIWGTGRERRFNTDHFKVSQPRDSGTCSRSIRNRPVRRCPTIDGKKITIQDVWQANYNGNDATVTQRATDNNSCVTAYITSVDAGRGTFGDCRGRTWLNSLDIFYRGYSDFDGALTPKINISGESFLDDNLDAAFSASYPLTTIKDFSDLVWNFEVAVNEKIDNKVVKSFQINSTSPEYRDYIATISNGQLTIVKKQ